MKHEIGKFVEAKSGSLTNWYEGQIVGYDDTNGVYVLHMCEEYPFTPYAGFSEDRIREIGMVDSGVITGATLEVKIGSGDFEKVGHIVDYDETNTESDAEVTERFEKEIDTKARELFNIWHGKANRGRTRFVLKEWDEAPVHSREGFRAIARHLATPQSDVQHALQAALESERELMDILRKIGKVFGKNVGTDIGILDLPKLVEKELWEIDGIACENKKLYLDAKKVAGELEAHRENSKQILRLNNWLQEHNLTKPGVCVTDTIIELLENPPQTPTPQLINAPRVMNAIHIKSELRGEMTEDRIIENLEILHRDAAGNFTLENKVSIVKKDPQLHDLITHLPDFHNAVRVRYDIAHSCGDEDEVSYWRRQLDVVNKLLELTK